MKLILHFRVLKMVKATRKYARGSNKIFQPFTFKVLFAQRILVEVGELLEGISLSCHVPA